jgi:glycosyltransferase involved in cell wall biosynthesis
VIAGLKAARAPYVGYLDADGSTEISEMMRLFLQLGAYDGAIGSRWVGGATMEVRQGLMRRLESRAFNLIIRLLFGLDYRDTQCGAKVFKKSAIDAVLPQIISRGFEFDVELLWRLKRAGFTVGEFPVRWKNTGGSRVGRSDMVQMLAGLLNIRFGLRQP